MKVTKVTPIKPVYNNKPRKTPQEIKEMIKEGIPRGPAS